MKIQNPNLKMKNNNLKLNIILTLMIFLVVFLLPKISLATTYYIDFENGSDNNDGLSPNTAWKHFPDDGNASGNARSLKHDKIRPGDTFLFKGGVVYRGNFYIDGRFSYGDPGNPIVVKGDGWGNEKAIIDGSTLITGSWQKCPSQGFCANNPNWNNIYYIDLTGNYSFSQGFFEDDEFLWYAQDPNPAEPFFYDRLEYLRRIPQNDPEIKQTRTSITDPRYFTQSDPNFWQGAYVIAWIIPNVTAIRKITGYDPSTHTIYHEDLGGDLYTDRDSYYSVLNHVSLIDTPGEFAFDEANKKLYVWPRNNNINSHQYSIRTMGDAIVASGVKNINIEGFIIQKFVMGIRVYQTGGGVPVPENVVIKNNELRKFKADDWYAIQAGAINGLIENNKVIDAYRAVGILAGGDNVIIRNNFVSRASRQGIWFMGAKNSTIENNIVEKCKGTHANGISVYSNSENITVRNNFVTDSNIPFTMENTKDINIYNNVFDANEESIYPIAGWGGMTGVINIFNNTIVGSANDALFIRDCGVTNQVFFKNNISDGALWGERSNNIFTNNSYNIGSNLYPGEKIETDLTKIFVNPSNKDFHLKANSPAINTGVNLSNYFTTDKDGISRPQGSAWDIGAYEYVEAASPDTTPPAAPRNLTII